MPADPQTEGGGSFVGRRSAAHHRRAVAETYYEIEMLATGTAGGP